MKTTIMKVSNGYALTGAYTDALGCEKEVKFYFDLNGFRIGGYTIHGVPVPATAWRHIGKQMGLPVKARKMKRWLANRAEILAAGTIEVAS